MTVQNVPKVVTQMAEVMKKLTKLGKDKKAPKEAGGFSYRGIDDLLNTLHPLLVDMKLIVTPRVLPERSEVQFHNERGMPYLSVVYVEYVFQSIEDGSEKVVGPVQGTGAGNLDKMAGKAMTSAIKTAMYQAFCVPVDDASIDPEKDSGDNLRTDQAGQQATEQPKAEGEGTFTEPPPELPAEESKEQRHRKELSDILMKLSVKDTQKAKEMLTKWSYFVGTTDKKEHFINSLQSPNDPKKWHPGLKGKWLDVILSNARDALAAQEQ